MTQVSTMSDEAGGKINGGVVVQEDMFETGAVATGTTTIPADDTIPQNTEGTEFMALTFTPTSANNWLYIDVVCILRHSSTVASLTAALFKDSGASAIAVGWSSKNNTGNSGGEVTFTHRILAGSTSAQIFKVRAGTNSAGTTTFNGQASARKYGGTLASSIHIREVSPYKILPSGFLTSPFSTSYTSPEQTITSAGALTLAHGLGVMPSLIQSRLVCKTAELGYSIGDEVIIASAHDGVSSADNVGMSATLDSTNISIRYGSLVAAFAILNKTTGAGANITNANWKLVVRAWA